MNTQKTSPSLDKLYKFRERVKSAILGETNAETRSELEFVLERTDQKIRETAKEQGKIVRWN